MVLNLIFVFCFGLIFGSFMNVLIFRLGKKDGIFTGRSECPQCLARLHWYDLFPLFSYVQLRGRCRYCSTNISKVYPVVEATTGIIFTLLFFMRWPIIDLHFFIYGFLIFFLVFIFFYDSLYLIIPDKIVFPLIGFMLIYNFIFRIKDFENLLLTGVFMSLFFATMYIISGGRWMGLGDAKLVFLLGLIFGYPIGFWVVVFSIWSAALAGIGMIIFKKASLKTALPFGAFLSVVSILFIIFEHEIQSQLQFINWIF